MIQTGVTVARVGWARVEMDGTKMVVVRGVSLGWGPERLAEKRGVRQHWGMGRRGVISIVRVRRQLVNGRIRTQLLTWIFPFSSQLWKKGTSEGFGLFLEQRRFGAVGIQTGGKKQVNARETGKKS